VTAPIVGVLDEVGFRLDRPGPCAGRKVNRSGTGAERVSKCHQRTGVKTAGTVPNSSRTTMSARTRSGDASTNRTPSNFANGGGLWWD